MHELPTFGKLVVLSGPAGVGKDTVLNEWIARNPRIVRVVTYTTRQPRNGEQNGIDYHFVSHDRFHELAAQNHFLEHKEYNGNFYATPLTDMEEILAKGSVAVLKIEVKGAMEVRKLRKDALLIFLMPPDLKTLEHRIRSRATEDEETILKRLRIAHDEIERAEYYDFLVVNNDLDQCVNELNRVIG